MFDHESYNKSLIEHKDFKCSCIYNKSANVHNAIILTYEFTNDGVTLEFLVTFDKETKEMDRTFISHDKQCEHYTYVEGYMYNKDNGTFDSSLTQNCIPYFQNIGFKYYKLERPNAIKSSRIKNDDFILIPNQVELEKLIQTRVTDMLKQGIVEFK